ncbi:MAG: hypothetical protein AAF214_02060 [Pseudomonadota bacterium]
MSPNRVDAYFARHALKRGKDFAHGGLCPPDHARNAIPGLEMTGKFWYTYRAVKDGKLSLVRHDSFDDAAAWVIEKARIAKRQS